jgi:putative chitinase
MIALDRSALEALTPGAQVLYRQTFEYFDAHLQAFGILESKLRAEHFLAQVLHETAGLRAIVENLNYSAQRLCEVWPARFPSLAEAQPFAHNSRALANKTYGDRMGNINPNDGWRFLGRGLLQLTGRDNYARVGHVLGQDFVGYPAAVLDPDNALRVAGLVWKLADCNAGADADDIERVTFGINGGLLGLPERRAWLQKVRAASVIHQ